MSFTLFSSRPLGPIPHPYSEIIARTIFADILFVILTESMFQFLRFLHRRGIITRPQGLGTPEDRDLTQALTAATSVTLPMAIFMSLNHDWFATHTVSTFNVIDALIVQLYLFLMVDTWYFWGHRHMHKNKFLWTHVHSHHHEKKNLNVYSTAYAVFVENLLLVAPVVILSISLYTLASGFYNRISWELAIATQAIIFNLGHGGYRMHWIMYFMNPPTGLVHRIPAIWGLSQDPEDHELHHLLPTANFGLNFRIWDTIMGSYKPIEYMLDIRKRTKTAAAAK